MTERARRVTSGHTCVTSQAENKPASTLTPVIARTSTTSVLAGASDVSIVTVSSIARASLISSLSTPPCRQEPCRNPGLPPACQRIRQVPAERKSPVRLEIALGAREMHLQGFHAPPHVRDRDIQIIDMALEGIRPPRETFAHGALTPCPVGSVALCKADTVLNRLLMVALDARPLVGEALSETVELRRVEDGGRALARGQLGVDSPGGHRFRHILSQAANGGHPLRVHAGGAMDAQQPEPDLVLHGERRRLDRSSAQLGANMAPLHLLKRLLYLVLLGLPKLPLELLCPLFPFPQDSRGQIPILLLPAAHAPQPVLKATLGAAIAGLQRNLAPFVAIDLMLERAQSPPPPALFPQLQLHGPDLSLAMKGGKQNQPRSTDSADSAADIHHR